MQSGRSAEGLEQLRERFLVRAKVTFDEMFGQDGQNGLVTFTEREDRACEATDALARWLLEEHLAQDEAKEPGVRVDCPIRSRIPRPCSWILRACCAYARRWHEFAVSPPRRPNRRRNRNFC